MTAGARTSRGFVRRVSIGLVVGVLVVGLAGLASIRFSTLRSDMVADVVDPAIIANAAALQAMTDAPSSPATPSAVDRLLVPVDRAADDAPRLRTSLATERGSAITADPTAFRTASAQVGVELSRQRSRLLATADRLRLAARLSFAALVLLILGLMSGVRAFAERYYLAPQRRLTEVVERLRRGDQEARAPIDQGSAEVRQVAVALNGLADEVDAWRSAQSETERLRHTSVDISRTVREELHIEAVLRAIPMIGPALQADRSWLRLVQDGSFGPVVREWAAPGVDLVGGDIPMAGDNPFELAEDLWRRGEVFSLPYLSEEVDLGQRGLAAFVALTGARSLLVVPVGAGEQLYGLLGLAMTTGPRGWTAEEVSWAQRVAADLGRALEHARLFEQQRELVGKLRDLDRRKDDFLSTVSHELRTPLTSITGYLEIVRDGEAGPVTDDMARMLEVVDRNAARLCALIDDLLVLARIEEGSLDFSHGHVLVASLVEQAADTVRPQAEAGGVALTVDSGPAGLTVVGDARHLEMVVLNLLSNALKFTPRGGQASVRVRYDASVDELLLTCADSGIGIPETDQAGMFGRFFRASNAASHAVPGTGLGLSVIKGIVEAHGGAVALTSREDRGTIVTVRLPGASLAPGNDRDAAGRSIVVPSA